MGQISGEDEIYLWGLQTFGDQVWFMVYPILHTGNYLDVNLRFFSGLYCNKFLLHVIYRKLGHHWDSLSLKAASFCSLSWIMSSIQWLNLTLRKVSFFILFYFFFKFFFGFLLFEGVLRTCISCFSIELPFCCLHQVQLG